MQCWLVGEDRLSCWVVGVPHGFELEGRDVADLAMQAGLVVPLDQVDGGGLERDFDVRSVSCSLKTQWHADAPIRDRLSAGRLQLSSSQAGLNVKVDRQVHGSLDFVGIPWVVERCFGPRQRVSFTPQLEEASWLRDEIPASVEDAGASPTGALSHGRSATLGDPDPFVGAGGRGQHLPAL